MDNWQTEDNRGAVCFQCSFLGCPTQNVNFAIVASHEDRPEHLASHKQKQPNNMGWTGSAILVPCSTPSGQA